MGRITLPGLLLLTTLSASIGCGSGSNAPSPGKPGEPDTAYKAGMSISTAQSFERVRKNKQAVEEYRRVVKEYPDTPQAKFASERIEALRGK